MWLNRGAVTCGGLLLSSEPCVFKLVSVGSSWATCGSPPPRRVAALHLLEVEAVTVLLDRGAFTCGDLPPSSEPCVVNLVAVGAVLRADIHSVASFDVTFET